MINQFKYQFRYALPMWFVFLLTSWLPDNRFSIRLRGYLISLLLLDRPKGLCLARDVTLLNVDGLKVGRDVYLAKGVWVNALGGVSIEDEVIVSPYAVIASTRHAFENDSVRFGGTHLRSVRIGRGSWVSSHVTVAAGAVIGVGALVGANSLVQGNVEDNTVVSGVPVRFVKARVDNPGKTKNAR